MASKRKVSLWTKAQAQCTSVTDQIFKETSQKSQLNEKKLISPALKPTESPPTSQADRENWTNPGDLDD